MNEILNLICKEYGITRDEFESGFKYGRLSEARQLYVLVLFDSGMKNKDISKLTGYSPARITLMIRSARETAGLVPYFRKKYEILKKYFVN